MTDDRIETTDAVDLPKQTYVLKTVRELFDNERVGDMYLGDVLLAELAIHGLEVVKRDWSK